MKKENGVSNLFAACLIWLSFWKTGAVRYVNPAAEKVLGYKPGEFAGMLDGTVGRTANALCREDGYC